jgi:hypothetical protein
LLIFPTKTLKQVAAQIQGQDYSFFNIYLNPYIQAEKSILMLLTLFLMKGMFPHL